MRVNPNDLGLILQELETLLINSQSQLLLNRKNI